MQVKAAQRDGTLVPGSAQPARVRVGLIGEGTYPVVKGGVSTWCDQLVTGLSDHEFAVVTLVGADRTSQWEIPSNVTSTTLVPMWDPPPRAPLFGRHSEGRRVRNLLSSLWNVALPNGETQQQQVQTATAALRELAHTSRHRLAATLARHSSAQAVLAAWQRHREGLGFLPTLTLSEAAQVSRLADRILAVLDTEWPEVDLIHVASNGPASLIALARHWRDGTPLILTEHGVYLRERYLALGDLKLSWPVRYALMGLVRLVCQVTYAESERLAPVSDFNARWASKLGADAERMATVHNGVNVAAYPLLETEPDTPTVSFVGRIDPLKDLHTLLESFSIVHARMPEAKLRIFGPVPTQNKAYYADLQEKVQACGLSASVTFEGPAPNARVAAEAGHVVALSSISEGLPFTVIESMMCGRATVSTDVGGVAECTGRDGVAGLIVPAKEPAALAEGLLELLSDTDRRHRMGAAARARAERMFSLDLFYTRIRDLYRESLAPQEIHFVPTLDAQWPPLELTALTALTALPAAGVSTRRPLPAARLLDLRDEAEAPAIRCAASTERLAGWNRQQAPATRVVADGDPGAEVTLDLREPLAKRTVRVARALVSARNDATS